jgi:polysaccharide export outer membrane protein
MNSKRPYRLFPDILQTLMLLAWLVIPLQAQFSQITRGDILDIVIYNRPELSKTVTVRADGTVDYPFIMNIPIDALSIDEFRDLLIAQVAKYTGETPIITVQYSRRPSLQVVVLGQVRSPGEILVPQKATIQGALSLAGGTTPQAELNRVKIIRGENDPKDTIYVDLYDFSLKGDPGLLPPLQDGDILFVPGIPGISDVKVIGEVASPGNLTVPPGTSLLDVLYLAGGPTRDADLNHIRLYDSRKKEDRRYRLMDLVKKNRFDEIPGVNPGNVVVIETKPRFFKNMIEVLTVITSVTMPVILILYYLGVIDRRW